MSDIMLDREKLNKVLTQEKRVAVNMDLVREGYNADYYSMENTNADLLFIEQALSTQENRVLQDEEYRELKTIKGRNVSHRLLNQQKFLGDSKEMKRVKDSIADLEKLLVEGQLLDGDKLNNARLVEVDTAFVKAMKMCDDYISTKNPWFSKGIERKNMVIAQKMQLMEEYNLFAIGRTAFKYKLGSGKAVSPADLITLGREREDTIDSTMYNYRVYFEANLSEGEKIYQDVCSRNPEFKKLTAPELPLELSEQLNMEIYHDQDSYNIVENAQKNYKAEESPHVDGGNLYLQSNYLYEIEEAYKIMHGNEGQYKKFESLFDAAFKKLNVCCKSADALTFMQNKVLSAKMSGKFGEEDKEKIGEVMAYYSSVLLADNVMGGRIVGIIKKLAKNELLDEYDIQILGNEVSLDSISAYQNRSTEDKSKEENGKSDAQNSGNEVKGSEKETLKNEGESNNLREIEIQVKNTTEESEKKLVIENEKKEKELEKYRTGNAFDNITKEEFEKISKESDQPTDEEVMDRQKQIANERVAQATKEYDQKMEWYKLELKKQQEYIAWYEKNHPEPKVTRQAQSRFDKVKGVHDREPDKTYFWKDIQRDLDDKACKEFSKDLNDWLKSKGYTKEDLKKALENNAGGEIVNKVETLLGEYRPKIYRKLVDKELGKVVNRVEREQEKQKPVCTDEQRPLDYRAYTILALKQEKEYFDGCVKSYLSGERKREYMEDDVKDMFALLFNFVYRNRVMDDDTARDFKLRLDKQKEEFDTMKTKDKIKSLQDIYNEMEAFIKKEDELVTDMLCYRIREDDEAMTDERIQDYIFHNQEYLNLDGVSFLAVKPTLKYPGLKRIEEPVRPDPAGFIPTVEEVKKIIKSEKEIR